MNTTTLHGGVRDYRMVIAYVGRAETIAGLGMIPLPMAAPVSAPRTAATIVREGGC